ncbi:hypothetical protein C6P40_002735 [Pichia californica]|uniref:UBC core domain-containing protein n=1 Tax=Pichia californica TaxID=460514 RepID=A0A9P6WP04_9ASCO|nr:hypothetical protein C6P42_003871 [[Candida] californica]KAG0690490.1 hypothetical protein C6P40_002735 [[Candida] californica]
MTSQRRLLKELHDSSNLPESILYLHPIDESNLYIWNCIIHPENSSNSYYKNGYFQLKIKIPQNYPIDPPIISFLIDKNKIDKNKNFKICTNIPHCNIDFKTGEICLDILKKNIWSPAWTLKSAIQAILILLDNQEPDSPLNVDMANLFRLNDKKAIESIINFYINNT